MLVGQLLASTVSYCHWMIDANSELIELCNAEDSDPEEEKDDKLRVDLCFPKFDVSTSLAKNVLSKNFSPTPHPEITTPPPEFLFFLS